MIYQGFRFIQQTLCSRSQESGVVRAKHSGNKLSILSTGYFPNASPLLRPYFARTGVRSQE
ncbi:hypothetical protein H5968_12170 [Sphaerospermopsis sp. LEGE 00249]|uniref:hypothetical protein n=1 Tax=Sphaerospermopsis sp. LEGE 00249 TaxID=1380707 RepID=UPI0019AF17D0|nr:hypothetical protein [Sphaerospermopsis sp. LEGE 00249]MBC5795883.1 hypothetical protein [Sphaerospermopsis sp. LEGE 00249]